MTAAVETSTDALEPARIAAIADLLRGGRTTVLGGAGLSTESGIPDYRGEGTARRARAPVKFMTFVRDPMARRRYWARAVVGWSRVQSAAPNDGHHALVALEKAGLLTGVVTQNVDRLHQRAGAEQVVELHGALDQVRCLGCSKLEPREAVQRRLLELNPTFAEQTAQANPDGDAEIDDELVLGFEVATCMSCGGHLKPDVVFFGESVPRDRVEKAYGWVDESDALLVLGTSLQLLSGLRFVRRAREQDKPVAIINLGATRGDDLATVKLEARLGEALPALAAALGA